VLKSHLITGRGYEALLEDSFSNFINERKKLFLDKIASLIGAEKQVLNEEKEASSFNELLNKNESKNIEFKSSIRVDMRTNQINKELEKEVLKTIVAFMNSNGGTLLIGVSDNKEILGIQKDIETLKKKDDDGFQQLIISLFNSHIGATNSENLSISFEEVQGKKVAVVKIKPSNKGVFLDSDEFYIRSGNTSKKLNNKETQEYIRQHF
jgi:predicted HTH transcriptional regulator